MYRASSRCNKQHNNFNASHKSKVTLRFVKYVLLFQHMASSCYLNLNWLKYSLLPTPAQTSTKLMVAMTCDSIIHFCCRWQDAQVIYREWSILVMRVIHFCRQTDLYRKFNTTCTITCLALRCSAISPHISWIHVVHLLLSACFSQPSWSILYQLAKKCVDF